MSTPASVAVSAGPESNSKLRGAVQGALRRISWRIVGITVAIMIGLDAWLVIDIVLAAGPRPFSAEEYLSGAIINLLMAFSMMFTTLIADELTDRGARRLTTYAWAVVIGSAAAALAQWEAHQWLHLRTRLDVPGIYPGSITQVPYEVLIMQPAIVFFEYLIWGAIIVYVYVNQRNAIRAAAKMNAAQVQRAEAQRRTLESRLQALQARVEPQFLFNTLAQVRELYDKDPAKGGQMLDDLIVYLRAALPQLRESTSTLQQELKLASAYLSIMRAHLRERLAVDIDVPQAVLVARVPPMTLLPLIDQVLVHELEQSATGGTIRMAARVRVGTLRMEISGDGRRPVTDGSSDALRDIRNRLHSLYGDRGMLDFQGSDAPGIRVVMEIPYEATDGCRR
jgi:hypothetical protein